jgi:hypothetical protein
MPADRASITQLIANLRALAERQVATSAERDAAIADCSALNAEISLDPELANIVPETVWHFLSSADVRFKDSSYAITQLSALASSLIYWEREVDSLGNRNG